MTSSTEYGEINVRVWCKKDTHSIFVEGKLICTQSVSTSLRVSSESKDCKAKLIFSSDYLKVGFWEQVDRKD